MSLEAKISELTAAVNNLIAVMGAQAGATTVPQTPVAATPAPGPVAPAMPAPPAFAPAPAAPVFAAPQAPAAPAAPFHDAASLIAYVMDAYKAMGPQKGAQIQGVLANLGYQNINDVKPEHYGALYQGVEALKRS